MPEDTWSPLICEDRPATYPDVTVTLPGELALALVRHGPQLINAIARLQRVAMIDDVASRKAHDRQVEQHRRRMAVAGVQAYRRWRRILAETPDPKARNTRLNELCAELVRWHGPYFNRDYTRHLIRERKKAVADYLVARRVRTIVHMYLDKATYPEIARKVGLSQGQVGRIVKANRSTIGRKWREAG